MKKLLYFLIAIIISLGIYYYLIPLLNNYKAEKNINRVRSIIAFTGNYYGYNSPKTELLDSNQVYEKIGFEDKKPDYTELHYKNKDVAAAIVYDNICYYKYYGEQISYEKMSNNSKCSIHGIVTSENCFTVNDNTITDYNKSCGNIVVIPEKINNIKINAIASNAFNKKGLTKVIVPSSIEDINSYAFSNNSINYLIVESKNINDYAFSNNKLSYILLKSENIGKHSFSNNLLENIVISNSVRVIDDYAFTNNKLTHINIVEGVTKIGDYAFSDNSLESVVMHNKLLEIGAGAFKNNRLVNVVIPSTVNIVGKEAFLKSSESNPKLSIIYNATNNNFNFNEIVGSNYSTVDISKI